MPALTANSVTLGEILEVRASPLSEEELWAVLSQSSDALQDVFLKGKARQRGLVTYTITPQSLLLCHNGRVKFTLHSGQSRNRSFTAPEIYSKQNKPNEGAWEKICIYSLGMTLYHAAEYEIPVGKPINLSDSLEGVLLSMCEESSQLRVTLARVLEVCRGHRGRRRFKDQISSLVAAVLGDDVPDNVEEDFNVVEEPVSVDHSEFINGPSPSISPDLVSPRSLPSPPPSRISTRAQPTAEELVGSNHRRTGSPTEESRSPPLKTPSPHVPHVLDKYKDVLERVRRDRSQSSSPLNLSNGVLSIDESQTSTGYQSRPSTRDQSRPGSSALQENGTSGTHLARPARSSSNNVGAHRLGPLHPDAPEPGYFEGPAKGLGADSRPRPDLVPTAGKSQMRRYDSETSISDSCSVVSGPQMSVLSDGRSSMVSITQGSYVPESYLTDGYESEPYLTSIGSSASRMAFREGKAPHISSDRQYSSTMELRRPLVNQASVDSLPAADEVDFASRRMPQRFLSVPDIHVSSGAPRTAKGRSGSKSKLKTFFGPEFVQVADDPNLSVVNISPRMAGSIPRGRRQVTVVLLNGQRLQMMIETTTTTQVLFDQVIKYLEVTEKVFFGLSQLQDGEHIFLDLDVKLAKYAPQNWKEEAKVPSEPFLLNFRVKFYVENVALLSHQKTIHQFYLQLRQDVLNSQLYCHEDAAFILGGIALQAETGDYHDSLGDQYFLSEHYIARRVIDKVSVDQVSQELPQSHKMCGGLTEEQTELEFITETQKLQEYGIHFYKVNTSKKKDSEAVWIGICVRGVTVYEARGHVKYPVFKHSWPMTKKLSFKKKKFFVQPKGNPDPPKLTFYTNHYKKSRYLFFLSQAFHKFQMKMRTRLAAIEPKAPYDEPENRVENGQTAVAHRQSPYNRNAASYRQSSLPVSLDSRRQESLELNQELPQFISRNRATDARCYSASDESEDSTTYHRQEVLPRQLSQDIDDERDVDMPYVIDSTLNSQTVEPAKSRDLLAADTEDGGNHEVLTSPDREIRVITFEKEPGKGLGITVLGGENSKRLDLGIFVKSVAEGGSAWKDGRLKAGDRILAVNGQSLEKVTHERAVSILKNATSPVNLVLSQSSYNISSFDLSSIPSANSASEEPENFEVKPLTPRDAPSSPPASQPETPREGSPEPRPSNFAFPSEDEPVTMISKSIPPSVLSTPNGPSRSRQPKQYVADSHDLSIDSSSLDSEDPVDTRAHPRRAPIETNVIQSSLLSATAPLVSASLVSPQWESSEAGQKSAPGGEEWKDETAKYSVDGLPEKAFAVDLEKKDGSLGLSVTGGINTTVKLGAIYVKSLQLNGPADLDGRIQIGDRILSVNGVSLVGVTHKQAVETIKMAPQTSRLVLDRSIPVIIPPKSTGKKPKSQAFDRPFLVDLVKGFGGLGLSLVGGEGAGEEHGGVLRIKKMFPGQPAASSGKLQIGDIILEVNGTGMTGVTHQEAINLIRMGPSQVKLLVKRDPSSIPSSLLQRTGSNASDVDPAQILADIQTKLKTEDSPSLSKRSSDASAKEPLSPKSDSLNLPNEAPQVKEVGLAVSGAPVSLKSSLMSEEPKVSRTSYPDMSRVDQAVLDRPGLNNRLSEPVMQVKKEHDLLAPSNSLPNVISVKSREQPWANRPAALQESEDALKMSAGDAPLAEDESSDVEDSRRSSSIDMIPPDRSVYDEESLKELMGRLSTVESNKDNRGLGGAAESDRLPSVNKDVMIPDEALPSPPSSDSEESDEEEGPVDGNDLELLSSVSDVQEDKQEPSMTPQEEILDIELVKGSGGLGFTLAGGADTMGGCFVRDIVGGPAKEDGRLQKGDQIMVVDGQDISTMKHMDAVNVLRTTKQRVKLVVLRRPSGLIGTTKSGPVEVVNLTRTSHGRIGLLIKEGEEQKIFVEDVVPGEPAATQGGLRQGDRILEINGAKVDGLGFVAARQHLDAARPVARLLVERRPRIAESKYAMGEPTPTDSGVLSPSWSLDGPDQNIAGSSDDDNDDDDENHAEAERNEQQEEDFQEDEQFTVKLDKGTRGFGFSLVAAPTINSDSQGIFIKTISPGSVAESDGRLRVGDQILKVNGEDVQGLSHARVIGMLRKITGKVELEIKRPSKFHIPDSIMNSPTLKKASLSDSNVAPVRAPFVRSPHSVDLDITLEDKDRTLTGSSDIQDEDDVTELLNAISVENNRYSPPTPPENSVRSKPPKLQKRDTDTVLSSLLESLEPPPSPPDSVRSVDPHEFDSQWESSYSDNDAPPDLVPNKPHGSRSSAYGTGSSVSGIDTIDEQFDDARAINPLGNGEQQKAAFENDIVVDESDDDHDLIDDDDDDDVDEDVFDMLRDNSQAVINMLNDNEVLSTRESNVTRNNNSLDTVDIPDIPPPVPTTPIPSDDDEPPVKPPPRRESLLKFSGYEEREEIHSGPLMNGSLNGHGSGDEVAGPSEPLIEVMEGGRYTGPQLSMLIRSLQEKIDANFPAEEFKALREMKPTDGCDTGKRQANKDKNRYRNVLPFENTRVKLSGDGDDNYINANHVKVPVGQNVYNYIATQGPLPNTTQDFWQMVWEQEVDVIAMVTLEREGGKVKCHRYWPESYNQPLVFTGSLKVSLQRHEDFGPFIEREFTITNLQTGEARTVYHINFIKWPDHGVPKSAADLVEFVRFMRLLADGPGPVIVHCSAGIGRTGALITIDVAIGLMERDLLFDVNKIIRNLREQRQGMIQTKDQYIFCYKACLDVLQSLTAD